MKVNTENDLKEFFEFYLNDERSKELLKNKDYETLSDNLSNALAKKLQIKHFMRKVVIPKFKTEFMNILKNYEVTYAENK